MKLFKFFLEPWLAGVAYSKMRKQKYKDAIEPLLKVIELTGSDTPGSELYLYDIGRCYLKINEIDKASYWYSKSYNAFKNREEVAKTKEFYDLLISYGYALEKLGRSEESNLIYTEAESLKKELP